MANENRDPRAYELMAVLIPDMPEEDTKAAIGRVSSFITGESGEVKDSLIESPWGRRRLAYTMRFNNVDYRDGYYVLTHFSATPNVITNIERELKLDTQVIRYLLVMDDPKAGEKDTGQNAEAEQQESTDSSATPAASDESTDTTATSDASSESSSDASVEGTPETASDVTAEPATDQEAAPVDQTETEDAAVAEVAEVDAAPATDTAEESTDDAAVEEAAAEVADQIEGEENPAPADAPVAAKRTPSSKLPGEGEGTDWVSGDGTDNVPVGFEIKGNASSKIYHPSESPNYSNTVAEIYFATPEAAERFGYRLPKTLQHAAEVAASSAADLAQKAADAASEEE